MVKKFLTQLENLAFKFQYRYMKPKKPRERVGRHYAFFHPRPTGKIVLDAYSRRTRTILVTGVFDILHSEHKKFLRAAKNLGGRLLVGVETDARVRVLKGSGRPVNPLAMRLRQLCQLKIADEVFALPEKFATEADRLAWLKKLQPDILAVSASDPNLPAKRKLMSCVGGRVIVVLPHNPKISTTKMLE